MARRCNVGLGVVGLLLALECTAGAATADRAVGPVRSIQDLPELGLSVGVTMEADGGAAVTATSGDWAMSKRVYADGRFVLRVATRGDDKLLITGAPHVMRVAYGSEGAVDLLDDRSADREGLARRVRGWLARSDAVQRFRQLNEALERQEALSPEGLSLRVSGALLAELLGDPGAAHRLSRSLVGRLAQRLRRVQNGQTSSSCWDTYQRLVVGAANQLESCLNSFAVYNPMRQACSFVWTLQVESAWFQFLSCSSFPMK